MGLQFELPSFFCPLPAPRPHFAEALLAARAMDWLGSLGLFTDPADRARTAGTHAHELMARMTPDAPADLTQLGVDWAYLAFAVDDLRTDTGVTSADPTALCLWFDGLDYASTTMDTTPLPGDLFYTAIADLSARIKARTTPALWRRWLADNKATYWAGLWEAAHHVSGRPADFNAFLAIRPHLGLGPSALTCAEIAAGLRVPEHERCDPLVRAATEAAWLLLTLDDDLYSYPKEQWMAERSGRDPAGMPAPIPILMREHRVTVPEAVRLLGQIRDRVMARVLHLAERVSQRPYSHDTKAMIDTALAAVRSTLNWAQNAPRYTNPDGRHPDAIHLRWTGVTPIPPPAADPLPYPAISWWWDV